MPAFRRASDYIRSRFGGRVQKVPVNAGFSCPNRDGTLSYEGCSYCNNSAFSPFYADASLSVAEQLSRGKQFFAAKYGCHRFFAYFQSYSCTHADLDVLHDIYEQALAVDGVVGLVIATRPDCLSEGVVELLADLSKKTSVRLEVGVESFCDLALQKANRCHDAKTALEALERVSAKTLISVLIFYLGCLANLSRASLPVLILFLLLGSVLLSCTTCRWWLKPLLQPYTRPIIVLCRFTLLMNILML